MTAFVIRNLAGRPIAVVQADDRLAAIELANAAAYGLIVRGLAVGEHLTIAEEDLVIKFEEDLRAGDVRGFRRAEG